MHEDPVGEEEMLFRGIRRSYIRWEGGEIKLSFEAFADRHFRVSVDRAARCENDPKYTQVDETDCVCTLHTLVVRRIDSVQRFLPDGVTVAQQFTARVEPEPVPQDVEKGVRENLAHAVIFADPHPEIGTKKVFRRLQDALTRLARWDKGIAPEQANSN